MLPKKSFSFTLRFLSGAAMVWFASVASGSSVPAIAAGGLVPHSDARIAVAKEVVHISDRKVWVDYDLRNDGAGDVTMDLGFPVPPYKNGWDALNPSVQSFRSLKVWADDKPVELKTEARAEVDGKDVTGILNKMKIDVPTFGHMVLARDQGSMMQRIFVTDYERLPEKEKHKLRNEGIFKGKEGYCLYTVYLEYHWPQTIPAHAKVHVRVEYLPAVGFTRVPADPETFQAEFKPASAQPGEGPGSSLGSDASILSGFCTDGDFVGRMLHAQKVLAESYGATVLPHWVDFTLMTDTGWHRPIEDFTLQIDVPQLDNGQQALVAFCTPGVVNKRDSDQLQIHMFNYTPGTNLHIGFFNVPIEAPGQPVAAK